MNVHVLVITAYGSERYSHLAQYVSTVSSFVFLTLVLLRPMHSSSHTPSQRPRASPRPSPRGTGTNNSPRYRPATIAELAEKAREEVWDPSKGVKFWLKTGEAHRKAGKAYGEANDLERSFVEYAKAATIVLERLPGHREYYETLNVEQRHNLGLVSPLLVCDFDAIRSEWTSTITSCARPIYISYILLIKQTLTRSKFTKCRISLTYVTIWQNGQDILDCLSDLKPTLVERHEQWALHNPNDTTSLPYLGQSSPPFSTQNGMKRETSRGKLDRGYSQEDERDRMYQAELARRAEQHRYDEQRRVEASKEDVRRSQEAERKQREDERRRWEVDQRGRSGVDDYDARRKEAAVAAARSAAGRSAQDSNYYSARPSPAPAVNADTQRRPQEYDRQQAEEVAVAAARRTGGQSSQDAGYYNVRPRDHASPAPPVNAEAQRRQQEFERQQAEMKKREEEIVRQRRQNEIAKRQEEADAAARVTRQNLASSSSFNQSNRGGTPSYLPQFPVVEDAPLLMPLESPTGNDEDYATDVESFTEGTVPWTRVKQQVQQNGASGRTPIRSYVYTEFFYLLSTDRLIFTLPVDHHTLHQSLPRRPLQVMHLCDTQRSCHNTSLNRAMPRPYSPCL